MNFSEIATIEHLTNTINNLNEKLNLLESKASELDYLRKTAQDSEKARVDLSICLKENANKVLEKTKVETEFKAELIKKNKEAMNEFQSLNERFIKIEQEKSVIKSDLEKTTQYIKVLESDIVTINENIINEEAMAKAMKELNAIIGEIKIKHEQVIS